MFTPTFRLRASSIGAALVFLLTLTACDALQDDMCIPGEQPIYAVDNPNGKSCIADDATVPDGFATYPEKRVPQKVGDEYDRWPLAEDYPWPDEVG
ncbi:hypothetical protein [Tessaracoccus sp.]